MSIESASAHDIATILALLQHSDIVGHYPGSGMSSDWGSVEPTGPSDASFLMQSLADAYSAEVQASARSGVPLEEGLSTLLSRRPADLSSLLSRKTSDTGDVGSRSTEHGLPVIELPEGIHEEQLSWNVKFVLTQFFLGNQVSASLLLKPGLTLELHALRSNFLEAQQNVFQVRRLMDPIIGGIDKDPWHTLTLRHVSGGFETKSETDGDDAPNRRQDAWGYGDLKHESILVPLTSDLKPLCFDLAEEDKQCGFMHAVVHKLGEGKYLLHYPNINYEQTFPNTPGRKNRGGPTLTAREIRKRGNTVPDTEKERERAKRRFGGLFGS
ncbi:hypothetical protein QFC21_004374 [Naganishia friedmannii]|uniref:Uncharacterized protein n=1 Tax=Naganishia friedmannii TaxID=89922 RepID=A0ACC2VJE2_9TREE|nr:hypothetical protein QFC21_004374 [Naganishia friedmannii]